VGHLVKVQDKYRGKVTVIGVTEATADEAAAFRREHGVTYHLLADAAAERDAYGIDVIWGNQLYLIGPNGTIVAEGPGDVDAYLARKLG